MSDDTCKSRASNLPLTKNGYLGVELVPMPSGDDPWRTQGDYRREQRRDTIRFRLTIASLIVSIVSVAATAITAIVTVRNAAQPAQTLGGQVAPPCDAEKTRVRQTQEVARPGEDGLERSK